MLKTVKNYSTAKKQKKKELYSLRENEICVFLKKILHKTSINKFFLYHSISRKNITSAFILFFFPLAILIKWVHCLCSWDTERN